MVELRKLMRELTKLLPDPSAEPVWQTKGLFENKPVLTRLFRARIAPNSDIFCQKVAEYDRKVGFFGIDFWRAS
jgi:hypothetical protein